MRLVDCLFACFNIENRDGEARRLRSSLRPQPLYVAAELQNTIPALEKSCVSFFSFSIHPVSNDLLWLSNPFMPIFRLSS